MAKKKQVNPVLDSSSNVFGWTRQVLLGGCVVGLMFSGCKPEEAPGPMCGGIAGIECPGAGECVDDPADDCDPEMGGADCGGICECNAIGLCVGDAVWDSSPDVCACVEYDPCIATLCPVGTLCVSEGGEAMCVPHDAGPVSESCGDTVCEAGLVCCNASCGICTEPGGACIQIACE